MDAITAEHDGDIQMARRRTSRRETTDAGSPASASAFIASATWSNAFSPS